MELGAKVDVLCSKSASSLAAEIKANNIFNYDELEFKDDLVEQILEGTKGEKYFAVMDCARDVSTEQSSVGWVGKVIHPDDSVVFGFNSPETAIKDATMTIIG